MTRRPPGATAALLALALAVGGCAVLHRGPAVPVAPVVVGPRQRIAMLPLENLSDKTEYVDRMTRVVWTAIGRDPRFEAVEPGEVDGVLSDLRIRSAGSLTRDQIEDASRRLETRWLVAGTLLECGSVRTPDGDVPSMALSLRLLDGRSGRVVWTDMASHSGEDRETVFGWGRETSLEAVASRTAQELVTQMRLPAASDSATGGKQP